MDLPPNSFKRGLAAGRPQIGLWSSLSASYTVEVLAGAGFDWLLLDTEHSPNDLESVLGQLQAMAPYPTAPVVRIPVNDSVLMKRYLDIGVQSFLIPMVNTAEEAAAAVAATRYPPAGVRGIASSTRANRFGRVPGYARRAAEEICVLVQVETRQALGNLAAIAKVEGVDGIFIGPGDLHASFGHAGEQANPAVLPVIDQALVDIRRAGKAPGIVTGDEQLARRWLELGSLFVAVGSDVSILSRGADALAKKYKG
jgi:4-hydroxy-2-oxoheptanedioate aldolase